MELLLLLCFAVSLTAVWWLMPHWIDVLKKISFNQTVSEYSLEEYRQKAKTPIMGGVLFILVPTVVSLCAMAWTHGGMDLLIVWITFVGYGLIGFVDDYLIVVKQNNDGLRPKQKMALQVLLAVIIFFLYRAHAELSVTLLFSGRTINLGWGYFLLILFMFTGASNAVNLTDGMDGLAAGCTAISLVPFFAFSVLQRNTAITSFIVALVGALIGYLRYNVKPARIFMGDTGSLALGAVLAALAMVLKKELLLIVVGGVFVIETLCVIIQLTSVKLRHKRVFPYTPIHYAFVIKGLSEQKTVRMFWMVSAIFGILGLLIGVH